MNPAYETESPSFVRRIVRELTAMLRREPEEGSPYDIGLRGGYTKIRIDGILLDVAPEIPEIVILFRDIAKPECLHRMRVEAAEPEIGTQDASLWAVVILSNFCEAIEAVPGLPEGSSSHITDVRI